MAPCTHPPYTGRTFLGPVVSGQNSGFLPPDLTDTDLPYTSVGHLNPWYFGTFWSLSINCSK